METETQIELEHRRDMIAIMLAILSAQHDVEKARTLALQCWDKANEVVGLTEKKPVPPSSPGRSAN